MRKREPELGICIGTNCPQVTITTSTGKKRKTLAATIEQLFRIIQSIPSPKAEPFKLWMAQVAAERLNLEEQLGHSIISREKATDYLPPADRWDSLPEEKDDDEN